MAKIKHRIGIALVLLSLFIASIVGLVSLWRSKKIIASEAEEKLLLTVQTYGAKFEEELSKIKHLSYSLESLLKGTYLEKEIAGSEEKMLLYKEKLIPVVNSYIDAYKPLTCWIIFDPSLAPGKHTISYEDINADGIYIREEEYRVSDFDLNDSSMLWWTEAIKYGEVWTKPYYWSNWEEELISFSKAVFVKEKLVACVGSDFGFTKLRRDLKEVKIYENGYLVLFDNKLNLLIHPEIKNKNLKEIFDNQTYADLVDQFRWKKLGKAFYHLQGRNKIMAYYQLSNGWYMAVVVSVDDIFHGSRKIFSAVLLIIVIGVVVSVITAAVLSNSLTRPIYQLVDQLRIGAKGNLAVRASLHSSVEISELANHFNLFMEKMQSMVRQLKDSETLLYKAKQRAEESDKLKSAFLANISHEVRTPLNAILGFSKLFTDEIVDKETKKKYLTYLNRSSEQLIGIVEDIMVFSQLEQGLLSARNEAINIELTLVEVLSDFKEKHKENQNDIKFVLLNECVLKTAVLHTDRIHLKRILYNLMHNAWKYTLKGTIAIGVHSVKENEVVFYVKDTGVGIPDEEKEKVFLKFYKYNPIKSRVFDGTGLGLSIAKDLVQLLGGEIWMESTLNVGTVIYFSCKDTIH